MGPTSRRWRAALQLISTQRATGDAEELVGERDQVVQHPGPGVLLVQVVVRRLLVCDFRLRGSLGARRSRRRRPCSSHCEMPTCRVDGAAIVERFLQPLERRQRPTGLRARARVRREEPAQSGRRRATSISPAGSSPASRGRSIRTFPYASTSLASSACKTRLQVSSFVTGLSSHAPNSRRGARRTKKCRHVKAVRCFFEPLRPAADSQRAAFRPLHSRLRQPHCCSRRGRRPALVQVKRESQAGTHARLLKGK